MPATPPILSIRQLFGHVGIAPVRAFIDASVTAVGPDKPALALTTLIAFASATFQTALLFALAMLAVTISTSQAPSTLIVLWFGDAFISVTSLLVASSILVAMVLILAVPLAQLQSRLAARAVERSRTQVIDAFMQTTQRYRAAQREGFLQQIIGEYCQNLASTVQSFTSFCVAFATLLVLLVFSVLISPKVAITLLATVILCFMCIGPVTALVRHNALMRSDANRGVAMHSAQLARVADEVITYDVGDAVNEQLRPRIRAAATALARTGFADALLPPLFQFGTLAVVVAGLGSLIILDPGRHPNLAVLALLLLRLIGYGRQLLNAVQSGSKSAPYIERIGQELAAMQANRREIGCRRDVGFDGLTVVEMGYVFPSGKQLLHDATMDIAPGSAVGIIGASGSGKSTLAAVLAGVRKPTSGCVETGGVDIADIAPDCWARMTAIVPQDTKLIAASVADNIRFFRSGFSLDDVIAAATAAHIHDEIMAFPRGYDTPIGAGGRGISGGQRQRLVIARALVGRPQFLVLDEPSSALDELSEALIAQSIAELKGKTTVLMVTHRPATLKYCDAVWRLSHGKLRLVESRLEAAQ